MKYKNNPFNIRKGSSRWLGSISKQGDKFESFDTLEHGIRAFFIIMRTYSVKYGRNTIRSIITRFAPPSENNVNSYIDFVSKNTNMAPDDLLMSWLDYLSIARFMAYYESLIVIRYSTLVYVWRYFHISNKSFPSVKDDLATSSRDYTDSLYKCETYDALPF